MAGSCGHDKADQVIKLDLNGGSGLAIFEIKGYVARICDLMQCILGHFKKSSVISSGSILCYAVNRAPHQKG